MPTTTPDPQDNEEVAPKPVDAVAPGGSAHLVGLGILASRVFGLLRDSFIAKYFGLSDYADVFKAALRMPNVLQNLLGEGTLSASFIPVYARLLERGEEEEAGRVAGAIFALLLAVAGALTIIGILLSPLLVSIFFPLYTGEKRDLTIACTRIIFPMTGILVLSAWSLGVLNAHRRFFLPYVAPVFWNAAMIATLVAFGSAMTQDRLVVALAWGAFVGGIFQLMVQLPTVLRIERKLRIRWNTKEPGVRTTLRNAGPAVAGRGVVQLSGWFDVFLAGLLGTGALAALASAQTLYLLPISLFGMSVAAAELPELSRQGSEATERLRDRINRSLGQIALLVVPSAIGYLMLGDIAVAAIYQRGAFGPSDTRFVWLVLAAYSLGLIASTATRLFSSAYFALHDTRTPAKVAVSRVLLSGGLGGAATAYVLLVDREAMRFGVIGLALATSAAAWVEWLRLRRGLIRRLGGVGIGRGLLLRLIAAAVVAGLIGFAISRVLPDVGPILRAIAVFGPFGAAYLILARLFGVPEATAMASRLLRRFR